MPKERAPETRDLIEEFLKFHNVTHPVRLSQAGKNGHNFVEIWTGEMIDTVKGEEISTQAILESRKTGCLVSFKDDVKQVVFIHEGKIIKAADGRQLQML